MSNLGFQRSTLIGTGWPDGIDREIKACIELRQLTNPITTQGLRNLVRQQRWADIGKIFDFEPTYTEIAGAIYFNWTSCPASFWAVFQPHKYARGKRGPEKTMFRGKRLATKPHPTTKMATFQSQKGVCYYCEKDIDYKQWSVDHKTPRCRGGTNGKENKVGACKTCNNSKSLLTEEEYRCTHPDDRKKLIKSFFKEQRGLGKMK